MILAVVPAVALHAAVAVANLLLAPATRVRIMRPPAPTAGDQPPFLSFHAKTARSIAATASSPIARPAQRAATPAEPADIAAATAAGAVDVIAAGAATAADVTAGSPEPDQSQLTLVESDLSGRSLFIVG